MITTSTLDTIVDRLQARRTAKGWEARCPAHEDRQASLSIGVGDDGRVLLHCHAGCTVEAVVGALGMQVRDLMPAQNSHGRSTQNGNGHAKTGKSPKRYATAGEALAALERIHGKHSSLWKYYDAAGNLVGGVVRWDTPKGKVIRPVSLFGDHWRIAGMPAPRPLYNLVEVVNAPRVFVGEGEKVVEALRSIGLVATTSPHGADSAREADWTPLAGRELIGLPDCDKPGCKYIETVGEILWNIQPRATLRVVNLPGLAEGEDAYDWIEHHGDAAEPESMVEEIEALIAAAPIWTPTAVENPAANPGTAAATFPPILGESKINGPVSFGTQPAQLSRIVATESVSPQPDGSIED